MASKPTDQNVLRHDQSNRPELDCADEQGTTAQAYLYEIEACATRFAETGAESLIDLRCLDALSEERGILGILLGLGEVTAVVEPPCNAEVHQTSIPCVWLVRLRNDIEEIVDEWIEIAKVPGVIAGDRNAVMPKLEAMRSARQNFP
jgi:hypothetical protein